MDYYESAEGVTITNKRAKQEVEKHGACWDEFIVDMGEKEQYNAQDVLGWLGY
jgi:hypothetical protein